MQNSCIIKFSPLLLFIVRAWCLVYFWLYTWKAVFLDHVSFSEINVHEESTVY